MKRIFFSYPIIILLLASASVAEFQVNTHTSNDQKNAAIAMDTEGNFVVVWSSYLQDGSSNGIFGQLFDPNGISIGDEFQINTTTSGNQTESSVAMDSVGNFIVSWHGPGIDEEDIFTQRFDPYGQPLGDELYVNSYTQGKQQYPKVTMNGAGNFAVVWESDKLIADKIMRVASCQLFDVNGLFVGEEFDVISLADCRYPNVAMDPNGNFTIVWMEDRSSKTRIIMAQLYNFDGTAKTVPFEVSTIKSCCLTEPTIAMNDSGYFVITWDGDPELARLDDIHARLFDPNGTPIDEQFMVNTTLDGPQQYPHVAMNNEDQFIIVWNSQTGTQSSERDIFGQLYDSLGLPIGEEFQLNTYVEGDQRYSDIALSETGVFVTVWQSDVQDGSGYGIFGEINSIVGLENLVPGDLINLNEL